MSTIPTIETDHFYAQKNIGRGARHKAEALLEEILAAGKVDILALEARATALETYQSGLQDPKDSVRLATAAALPAVTAAGTGAGKTLTADAVGALTVDGVAVALGDRILVKDQVAGKDNGIYTVTTLGTGAVEFVLTRAADADEDDEVTPGMAVPVEAGDVNALKVFRLTNTAAITVDTTALVFNALSGNVMRRTVWVDGAAVAAVANGSPERPFATIQAAVDYCESLTIPAFDGWNVMVMPGSYTESVVITKNDVHLFCPMPQGAFIAGAAAGYPAITLTNATKASLTTYRSSGTYSDLVNDGAGPRDNFIANLYLAGGGGGANAMEYLGVKGDDTADTTDFGDQAFFMAEVSISGTFFAKNVNSLSWVGGRCSSGVTLNEVANFQSRDVQMVGAFSAQWDGADADGWTSTAFSQCTQEGHTIGGKVTIGTGLTWSPSRISCGGEVEVNDTGAITGRMLDIAGDFDINGASGAIAVARPYIGGDLTATVGKTLTLHDPHIAGAVTLDNGAGACVFNGGQYMGALTDVGGRLTFNLGTIGT